MWLSAGVSVWTSARLGPATEAERGLVANVRRVLRERKRSERQTIKLKEKRHRRCTQ